MKKKTKELAKAVIEKDGKYLLLKRVGGSFPDSWDFPGGKLKLKFNETPTEAMKREMKEETSLDIVLGPEVKKFLHESPKCLRLFRYFVPKLVTGEVKLSPDHSEYKWASQEDFDTLDLHPSVTSYFNNISSNSNQ